MSVERHTQDLPDDLEYLVETYRDREEDVLEQGDGIPKGEWDMTFGPWWTVKEDDPIRHGHWNWYRERLRWYFGNHVTLHRMLPDGTFEPWEVVND